MKEALLTLRDNLENLASVTDESAEIVELDQSKVGRLSRMDAIQAQAMAQEAVRRRKEMLRNIAAALARIEAGDYGLCQHCDDPINPRRLEVNPTALYCIDCASGLD